MLILYLYTKSLELLFSRLFACITLFMQQVVNKQKISFNLSYSKKHA